MTGKRVLGEKPRPQPSGRLPQLYKYKDCVAAVSMFGAEAEQVAGTMLLCLAWQGWVYKGIQVPQLDKSND